MVIALDIKVVEPHVFDEFAIQYEIYCLGPCMIFMGCHLDVRLTVIQQYILMPFMSLNQYFTIEPSRLWRAGIESFHQVR